VDLYCDNCEASWGIKYIEGMPTAVKTGPVADRMPKEQTKIEAHREKWDPEYAKYMEGKRKWAAERAAERVVEEAARRAQREAEEEERGE